MAATKSSSTTPLKATCLVLYAQHKSAGLAAMHLLNAWLKVAYGRVDVWTCDNKLWDWSFFGCPSALGEPTNATPSMSHTFPLPRGLPSIGGPRMLVNGLVLPLAGAAPWARPGCRWLTIFREPVARMVSALYYCKQLAAAGQLLLQHDPHALVPHDPLCGEAHLNLTSATPLSFACHWGNYAFRELLLHPRLHSLASAESTPVVTRGPLHRDPVWWVWRRHLQGGDDPTTAAGAANFAALRRELPHMFDLIGVVERWDELCALLNQLLPVPGFDFAAAATRIDGSHGSAAWKAQQVAALVEARAEPAVRRHIEADIALYEGSVLPLFDRQLRMGKWLDQAIVT